MSEHLRDIEAVVRSVVANRPSAASGAAQTLDRPLWDELDQLGFTALTVSAELGGSGGQLIEAAAVVRATALSAAPIMEAAFLAGPLLVAAQLPWPGGVVTAAAAPYVSADAGMRLSGRVARVGWLRDADHAALLVGCGPETVIAIIAIQAPGVGVQTGLNLAGEPRDDLVLDAVVPVAVATHRDPTAPQRFAAYGALGKAVQMAGAAERALTATVRHVREREQFGRPLVAFQAVQQQLAGLAANVATVQVAAEAAVLMLVDESPNAPLAIAAAKAEASTLARAIAATSHQLHGAIGLTREHALGAATTRLWAWREEFGNELVWHEQVAQLVDDAGGDIWALLTGVGAAQLSGQPT